MKAFFLTLLKRLSLAETLRFECEIDFDFDIVKFLLFYMCAPFPSDTLLVSMDVTFLYTNIAYQEGIQACEEVWEERKVMDRPTQTLVKLLTLILKCNNSEFNGNNYI